MESPSGALFHWSKDALPNTSGFMVLPSSVKSVMFILLSSLHFVIVFLVFNLNQCFCVSIRNRKLFC